jgi:hypothetical protein
MLLVSMRGAIRSFGIAYLCAHLGGVRVDLRSDRRGENYPDVEKVMGRMNEISERLAWWAAALAVVLFSAALVRQHAAVNAASEMVSIAAEQTFRQNLRLRLLGEAFPEGSFRTLDGDRWASAPAVEGIGVVWVVEPPACSACMNEVQQINRSILPDYPSALTILSGMEPAAAARLVEDWGIRTRVFVDEAEWVRAELGLPFPSSFLVLNGHGVIVHGEFHRGAEACRIDVMELAQRLTMGSDPFPDRPLPP